MVASVVVAAAAEAAEAAAASRPGSRLLCASSVRGRCKAAELVQDTPLAALVLLDFQVICLRAPSDRTLRRAWTCRAARLLYCAPCCRKKPLTCKFPLSSIAATCAGSHASMVKLDSAYVHPEGTVAPCAREADQRPVSDRGPVGVHRRAVETHVVALQSLDPLEKEKRERAAGTFDAAHCVGGPRCAERRRRG